MKDYSLNDNDRKNFILNYKIVGQKIKINYADSTSEFVTYTKKKEEEILETMKMQISRSKLYKKQAEERYIKAKKCIVFCLSLLLLTNAILLKEYTPLLKLANYIKYFDLILLSTSLVSVGYFKVVSKDLKKNKLYLEKEEKILNLLNNQKKLNDKQKEKIDINVNTIDKVSYHGVKKLVECSIKEEEVEFVKTIPNKILVKRKIKK